MRVLATLLVSLVLLTGISMGQANAQPLPFEDHFKVYEAPDLYTVTGPFILSDQFGEEQVDFLEFDKFATPVEKNGEPVIDWIRHQTWWQFFEPQPTRRVWLENQFGAQEWFVKDARYLVLPAIKNEPGVPLPQTNHYKCYDAFGPPMDVPVQLVDQFGAWTGFAVHPELFCNPTEKILPDGLIYPIEDPHAHLACYRLEPPRFYGITVLAFDQFGEWQITVDEHVWLCVPSIKTEATPTLPSTWGGIKTRYE